MNKTCPRCSETLPADLGFFAPRDRRGRLDGWCRACRSEDQKARYRRRHLINNQSSGFPGTGRLNTLAAGQ